MKAILHFLLLNILLFLFTQLSAQTTILSMDFDSKNPWAEGWTTSENTNSFGWSVSNYKNFYITSNSANLSNIGLAYDGFDVTNTGTCHEDLLLTPFIDLSSYSNVILEMDYTQPGINGSNGIIQISTDFGVTWTALDTVPQTSYNEKSYRLDLSAYVGEAFVKIGFLHTDNQLPDRADYFAIDNVEIYEAGDRDAEVLSLTMEKYIEAGSKYLFGFFKNKGLETITSYDLNYSINGGTTFTHSVANTLLEPGQSASFFHFTQADLSTAGKHEIKFWTSNINQIGDDNPNNDSLSQPVYVVETPPEKQIFFGYFTGTWCGFCPDGTNRLKTIMNSNPGLNINVAAFHTGDAMTFQDGEEMAGEFTSSYPSATIDFYKFPEEEKLSITRDDWPSRISTRQAQVAPISVSFANAGWDSTTRVLSAIIRVDAFTDLDENLRINFMVVEDSIVGQGVGYDQADENGNYVVGYVHNWTLRGMLWGKWGYDGLMPATMTPGESIEVAVAYPVDPSFDETKIKIMALVYNYDENDFNNREIYNSVKISLPLTPMVNNTSIDKELLSAKVLNVYPNPFLDRLAIDYEVPKTAFTKVLVRDMFGKEIKTLVSGMVGKGMNNAYWNGTNGSGEKVTQGVYLISIETNGVITYKKVMFAG